MSTSITRHGLFLAILATARVATAHHVPEHVIPHPNPGSGFFGGYLAADRDRVLTSTAESSNVGKAHLFNVATGSLLQTFNDPDPALHNYFGQGVALAGNHVAVGSRDIGLNPMGGKVYLFDVQTGALRHTLTEPTAGDNFFPNEIVISGDKILVASEGGQNNNNPPFPAEVFLFDAISGALLHTFSQPPGNVSFGQRVAMDGNNIFIGAPQDNEARIFHFDATTGALLNTIEKPEFNRMDSISIEGNQFIVGNVGTFFPFSNDWNNRGRAFIYDLAGNLQHTLEHPLPGDDFFGGVVDLQDGLAIVTGHAGIRLDVVNPEPVIFDASTGEVLHFFTNSAPFDNFSLAVLAGDHVVISAVSYAPNTAEALMVYRTIPEPATASLGAAMLIAVCLTRRR